MKRSLVVVLLLVSLIFVVPTSATSQDDELVDLIDEYERQAQEEQFQELKETLEFQTFSSCDEMGTVLESYVKENFENFQGGYGRGGGVMPVMEQGEADFATDEATSSRAVTAPAQGDDGATKSSSVDYSTTNIQVAGVDEPDILKSDGDYLYYYSHQLQKVFIVRSPLDRETSMIDLDDAQVVSIINIPKIFQDLQMFLQDNQLIFVAQRWRQEPPIRSFLNRQSRVDVIVYDIDDIDDPKLVKFSDLDGSYQDARMIDNKLYVVSQLHANRWYLFNQGETEQLELSSDDFRPKTIDIAYTQRTDQQNLVITDKQFPYRVDVQQAPCDEVYYILPSKESVQQLGLLPSFTVVRVIDIDAPTETIETTTAFGNTQTIHMATDGLYLTSPLYVSHWFRCPAGRACVLPRFRDGQHTLVHKFAVDVQDGIDYVASSLIPGLPLSQYSMSQDARGFFRILTKTRREQVATQFFVLDPDLDLKGMLLDIEPGEEFKAARYIGNKLYLVTFEQTDPLFVIDLTDRADPDIIGELVIPGFSTYLHPFAPLQDGIQYLLGLGFDTIENQRGGTNTAGIKLDLYKVDYTDVDSQGNVSVEQVYTQTWGGEGSASESTQNPRMFVRDKNRQLVVLPMVLQERAGGENCSVETDAAGNVIHRECWPSNRFTTTFAGMKGIHVDIDDGIDEQFSYDYRDLIKKDTAGTFYEYDGSETPQINSRHFQQLKFRVGYLGDVLYTLNNLFGHFATMGTDNETYLYFDEDLSQ